VSYLLDTNVISEWVKSRPDPRVEQWLAGVDEDGVFLSVASFAEIRDGIERLPDGHRRRTLAAWLADDLPERFHRRILVIDERVAETWGVIMQRARRGGVTVGAMDGFFAATAAAHGLTLVTRNVRDFVALGISLLDPWRPPP
jgi:hypothetical protein